MTSKKNPYAKIVEWFDSQIGFTKTPLRPAPDYTLSPLYWLGALMAISFVLQGLTGLFMLLYYVPVPDQAYSSTMFVLKQVPLGHLIETFHLYNAYAMILVAFMHLMRNYFVSAQKYPRRLMWVAGVLLGFIVLGFGLTGYLLPWTVVSKSATDVAVGMLGLIPGQLGSILKFLTVGSGTDADLLRRFFAFHIVLFPAALLVLLSLKLYMFEVHGAYMPAYIKNHVRNLPWFPRIFLYASMIGLLFTALVISAASLYPLVLPPEFTPQAAASYVVQPDWYFLWMYQILKLSPFEGSGIVYALGMIAVIAMLLILLPFYDRGDERHPRSRPLYTTIGAIIIAEVVALTLWGYLTPGQIIPGPQAAATIAVAAGAASALSTIVLRRKPQARMSMRGPSGTKVDLGIRPIVLGLLMILMMLIAGYLWIIDVMTNQQSFGLLLSSELIAASMSIYVSVEPGRKEVNGIWLLTGYSVLALFLFLALAI
jgi:quinol-cytochrome oxidoreductase complex cytochrome b subunit